MPGRESFVYSSQAPLVGSIPETTVQLKQKLVAPGLAKKGISSARETNHAEQMLNDNLNFNDTQFEVLTLDPVISAITPV